MDSIHVDLDIHIVYFLFEFILMFTFIWIYYEFNVSRDALYYTHVVYWNVYFVGHNIFIIKGSVSH